MTDVPELVHPSTCPGRRRWTITAAAGGLALVVGLVAACGSSASAGTAVAGGTGAASAPASGSAAPRARARTARASEPRDPPRPGPSLPWPPAPSRCSPTSSQTTVNYSDSTTFTNSAAADLSAVTAGSCITAAALPTGAAGSGSSAAAAPTTSAPSSQSSTATTDNTGPFTATTVQLRDPVNGTCTVAGGFGGGAAAVAFRRAGQCPAVGPAQRCRSDRCAPAVRPTAVPSPPVSQGSAVRVASVSGPRERCRRSPAMSSS